jgi:hypothetical protein
MDCARRAAFWRTIEMVAPGYIETAIDAAGRTEPVHYHRS